MSAFAQFGRALRRRPPKLPRCPIRDCGRDRQIGTVMCQSCWLALPAELRERIAVTRAPSVAPWSVDRELALKAAIQFLEVETI